MNGPIYERERHYPRGARLADVALEHRHWCKPSGELVSMFSLKLPALTSDLAERSMVCCVDVWDVTPAELRELSDQMALAADELEAHQAQVRDSEGGVPCGQ